MTSLDEIDRNAAVNRQRALTLAAEPLGPRSRRRLRVERVTHIVPALFADSGVIGGAERYAFELARHMAEEVPTRLVSFGDHDRTERVGELDVRVIGQPHYVRGQRTNPIAGRLVWEVLSGDIIHCHQQHVLASSLAALTARLSGKRVFVTDLGGGGWDVSSYVSTDRWFDGHLHISEYSRSVSGQANKPWARVILGGVDSDRFSPASDVEMPGAVLFVGRLMAHKAIDVLIEAVDPDMPLEIVGRPYQPEYLDRLHHLATGKQVVFRHDFDDWSLIRAYRAALCIVLPSVYLDCYGAETPVPELLGQTVIEGMACGVPAICTNVASMPELVRDGVTGFVVPPSDSQALGEKLRWLRDHPVERRRMGAAARQDVVHRFTWSSVVKRCLDAYEGRQAEPSSATGDKYPSVESTEAMAKR